MTVVSFDEWKKKKQRGSAYNARGGLRDDVAQKEELGYDLCVFLTEERTAPDPNFERMNALWEDFHKLLGQLPHEHAYYYLLAYEAYCKGDLEDFAAQFDLYLESEKRLYGEVAGCDWWIDCFVWTFTPSFPGMYAKVAELFFKHWPLCAMGWVCEALEIADSQDGDIERELDLLTLAMTADPTCYLAHYLTAMAFYDMRLWRSALPYFERAAGSAMYSADPAFYFDYAWTADKAGKTELASGLYSSCVLLDETYPCAVNNLGCMLLRLDKPDEAFAQFNRAITLNLDGSLPYQNAVAALERMGHYAECEQFIADQVEKGRLNQSYLMEIPRLRKAAEGGEVLLGADRIWLSGGKNSEVAVDKRLILDELERRVQQTGELFGRKATVYDDESDYGREFFLMGGGRVDLLLRSGRDYIVVAVARGKGDGVLTVAKLAQQVALVKSQLAKRLQKVSGVLVANAITDEMRECRKSFPNEDLSLFVMDFTLTEDTN